MCTGTPLPTAASKILYVPWSFPANILFSLLRLSHNSSLIFHLQPSKVPAVLVTSAFLRRIRKVAKSDCQLCHISLYICSSVRPNGTTRLQMDGFFKFYIWIFFNRMSRNLKLLSNPIKIVSTLYDDICTFMIISLWILLKTRNVN